MRIGVDIRCLMDEQYSGISEVTYNLLKHLLEIDTQNQYVLFYNSAKAVRVPKFEYPNVEMLEFKYPSRFFNLGMRFLKIASVDKLIGGVDVFLMPNFLFINLSDDCKKIMLVHDLSFELYPEFFTWIKRLWHYLIGTKQLCLQADKVIAISENTKRDLINLYQVPEEKIVLAHPGIHSLFFQPVSDEDKKRVKEKYRLPEKYFFSLGNLEPRKNLGSLIAAFQHVAQDHALVIAGGEAWKFKQVYRRAHGLLSEERLKFLGYVDEKDKPALYALSKGFVYPSMYEGFGLPPLEAMAVGTPVICSHSSSLPEAVGSAAILVDPYNIEAIAQAIEQLATDEQLCVELSQKSKKQSELYHWEDTVKPFYNIIQSLK